MQLQKLNFISYKSIEFTQIIFKYSTAHSKQKNIPPSLRHLGMIDFKKTVDNDRRLLNEIKHGKFLKEKGAGEIWGWETTAGKKRWRRRVKMLTSHIESSMTVLEIGCGTGFFTKELEKTQAEVTAIDISSDLLNVAKEKIKKDNVKMMIDNAYKMSFEEFTFDTVVGSSVLHHLDIKLALKEIYRVLKPGGSAYFTEPNMLNPQIALQKNIPCIKRFLGDSPDETAFFLWNIKRKFIDAGFNEKIEIVPFDFLHPSLPKDLVAFSEYICNFLERVPLIRQFAGSLYIKAIK